jgi:hypothetical protein
VEWSRMPNVHELVQIVVELYEGIIDFATLLPQKLLLLLVMVLNLKLLVLRAVEEYLLRKLRDVDVGDCFY